MKKLTRNELLEKMINTGMSSTAYGLAMQRGKIPGISVIHKFGRNPDVGAAAFETIWDAGGAYTGFDATTPEVIEVFSSSANDAAAGTGARLLELRGLGPGFVEQIEVVALNGATPVNTVGTFLRMDRAIVLTAGSGGANEGTITVRQSVTTANVYATVLPGFNRTLIAAYTVPAGKTAYVFSGFGSIANKQAATSEVRARVRPPGSVFQIVENFAINSQGSSYVVREFMIPLIGVPAGTDFFIEADADTNGVAIAAGFEVVLVEDGTP